VDGLILKINYDFLRILEKRGLKVKNLKIRFLIRDIGRKGHRYVSYKSLAAYDLMASKVLNNGRYLCSAGDFPIIENIELVNANLKFTNDYRWYNITEDRYMVKKLDYDSFRGEFFGKETVRYEKLMNDLINKYVSDIQNAIDIRLNSYVDPCYVDAGYVSPNSEPNDTSTLLFTTPRYTFNATFPNLGAGQNYFVQFTLGGQAPSQNFPTYGFNTTQQVLAWIQTNWGNYGYWTITPSGQLQLTTNQSTQCILNISAVNVPMLKLQANGFTAMTTDQFGNPCNKPYISGGGSIIYPHIKHAWKFRITSTTATVNSFLFNLTGDFTGVQNAYIRSCTTGSATISNGIVTWNGTLTSGNFTDIEIAGDVTLGGKSDVYLGSGGYAHHTPPGINTLNNQACVPVNYTVIGTFVSSPSYYWNPGENTSTQNANLTTNTFEVYNYANGGNNLLTTGLPMIAGLNAQKRYSSMQLDSIPHLLNTNPTAWSKPLSVFATTINNYFQRIGYFWCLTTNNGSLPHIIFMSTYYTFPISGTNILNSSGQWQVDNNSDGTVDQTYNYSGIPKAGQTSTEYIDLVYPNIGSVYRGWNVNDVFFPS
jgi:hypothetical protein